MSTLASQLGKVVGEDNIGIGAEKLSPYFSGPVSDPKIIAVFPSSTGHVQEVVKIASPGKTPVFTRNGGVLSPDIASREGILIEFSHMKQIEKIDRRNLLVHVQRGVDFETINKEIASQGMRVLAPVLTRSESAAECLVNRNVLKAVNKYKEVHAWNIHVVLADGRLHKTGTHSLSEEGVDSREEAAASYSKFHYGSEDTFGIFTRATLMCYPDLGGRKVKVYAFNSREALAKAMHEVPRYEYGQEYIGMNAVYARWILGKEKDNVPDWILAIGSEAFPELLEFEIDMVGGFVQKAGGKEVKELAQDFLNRIDHPWFVPSPHFTAYYSAPRSQGKLRDTVMSGAKESKFSEKELGECMVSVNLGRNLHSIFSFFPDGGKVNVLELEKKLLKAGAFFDLPGGDLAREMYQSIPNYQRHLRKIKDLMDPDGILNPQVDYLFTKEKSELKKPDIPSPSVEGLEEAIKEIREKIGEEWVSNHPAELTSYARDFTVTPGTPPDMIVLPGSTEDVQHVMKVAYKYGLPVVVLGTGFNHGGLCLPRRGGILLDLRRMDRLVEIDDETMSALVEPVVRGRALWMDVIKHDFGDYTLKPILSMSFGGTSVLANYISRGAAGCLVKYGPNADLYSYTKMVLPDGEILEVGPDSVPGVERVMLPYGPGPEISGMFLNADGAFGVCTEMRVMLYPEKKQERILAATSFVDEFTDCEVACDAVYDLAQLNFCDFIYKFHGGVLAANAAMMAGSNPLEIVEMVPRHFLVVLLTTLNEKEMEIRIKKFEETAEKNNMTIIDPESMGMGEVLTNDVMKRNLGIRANQVTGYRGAFQWLLSYIKVEKVPQMNREYHEIMTNYWKPPNPKYSIPMALSGAGIQGPAPFARFGTIEYDWWWDHGNPDDNKRAGKVIQKAAENHIRNGGLFARNMLDLGEYQLERWGIYSEYYRRLKFVMDPADLMNPGVCGFQFEYLDDQGNLLAR